MTNTQTKTRTLYTTTLTTMGRKENSVPADGLQINAVFPYKYKDENKDIPSHYALITNAGMLNLYNSEIFKNVVHSILYQLPDSDSIVKQIRELGEEGNTYLDNHLTSRSLDQRSENLPFFEELEHKIWQYALNNSWTFKEVTPILFYHYEYNMIFIEGKQNYERIKEIGCPHEVDIEKRIVHERPNNIKGKRKLYINAPISKSRSIPKKATIESIDGNRIIFKELFYTDINEYFQDELDHLLLKYGISSINDLVGTTLVTKIVEFSSRKYGDYDVLMMDIDQTGRNYLKRVRAGLAVMDSDKVAKRLEELEKRKDKAAADLKEAQEKLAAIQGKVGMKNTWFATCRSQFNLMKKVSKAIADGNKKRESGV